MHELLYAIVLGIVEGVTEFLPVSSTGHLLLCERWMGLDLEDPAQVWKTFAIFIQIGAIMAVVVYFRARILALLLGRPDTQEAPPAEAAKAMPAEAAKAMPAEALPAAVPPPMTAAQRRHALAMIALASVPVFVVGLLAHDWIEAHLETNGVIAWALLIGGLVMLGVEIARPRVTTRHIEHLSWKQAMGIGLAQVLAAVFPGTSRSAATIVGGMMAGLSRDAAAEFSFFLAIPAMFAACGYALLKYFRGHPAAGAHEALLFIAGAVVSFLVAWAVIAAFMGYVRRHTFIPFAIYRVGLAIVVILLA